MESEGHHHEAPKSMWIPYGILAVLTIGIGLIGLSAEEELHHLFEEYLYTHLELNHLTITEKNLYYLDSFQDLTQLHLEHH